MAKVKFSGEIAKQILILLAGLTAATALTVTLAVMPGMGLVVKEILDWYRSKDSKKQHQIRKTFMAMRRQRLVEERLMPDGTTALALSEKGRRLVLRYNFDDLKIKKPEKWNGKWHFIIFDFPKKYVKEREYFRNKLKHCDFYQLQKSVWVHPFPCRDEIDFVSEYLRVSSHVRIVEVLDFDGSEEVKKFFFE